MNQTNRGRLAKKQHWPICKKPDLNSVDSHKEMVVLPKEKYVEMEENLKILSESK